MKTDEYVTIEQAQSLKHYGFDLECCGFYVKKYKDSDEMAFRSYLKAKNHNVDDDVPRCSAPTLAQAARWLREKKRMHVQAMLNGVCTHYFANVYDLVNGNVINGEVLLPTYEAALSEGITLALDYLDVQGADEWVRFF